MAKSVYEYKTKVRNLKGVVVDKTLSLDKGKKLGESVVPAHFFGQVAFHVDNTNGVIYDCLAGIQSLCGGKIKLLNGVAENPNQDIFIIECEERKDKDGKHTQDVFVVYEAKEA